MKETYQTRTAAATTDELVMPESVTLAMADLAGAVEEGLLALAVGVVGITEVRVMMQESVTGLCGPNRPGWRGSAAPSSLPLPSRIGTPVRSVS